MKTKLTIGLSIVAVLFLASIGIAMSTPTEATGTSSITVQVTNFYQPVSTGYWVQVCHFYLKQPTHTYITCANYYTNANGQIVVTMNAGSKAWYVVTGPSSTTGINYGCEDTSEMWFSSTIGAMLHYTAGLACT